MRLKQPRIEKYAENMTFILLNLVQGTLFKLKYGSHARLLSENVCAYNKADSNSVFHVQMWHSHETVKIPVLSLISKRGNNLCSYSLTFLTVLLLINFQKIFLCRVLSTPLLQIRQVVNQHFLSNPSLWSYGNKHYQVAKGFAEFIDKNVNDALEVISLNE